MTDPEWKDATSFSRDDKDRVPNVWAMALGNDLRISVVRNHVRSPGSWVMNCLPWYDTHNLGFASTAENEAPAKAKAIEAVRKRIARISEALERVPS